MAAYQTFYETIIMYMKERWERLTWNRSPAVC